MRLDLSKISVYDAIKLRDAINCEETLSKMMGLDIETEDANANEYWKLAKTVTEIRNKCRGDILDLLNDINSYAHLQPRHIINFLNAQNDDK